MFRIAVLENGPTATRLRDEGNHKFRLNDNDASMKLYTEVRIKETWII